MRAERLAASGRRSADQDRAARVAASKETEEETEVVEADSSDDVPTEGGAVDAESVIEDETPSETETSEEEQTESENAELEPTNDENPTAEDEKEA
jgi:hypothetical protein